MAMSDLRGNGAEDDEHGYGGVASQNYFRPGESTRYCSWSALMTPDRRFCTCSIRGE